MRTLLIGADGQVGWELWSRLREKGPVVATTRSGRLPDGSACHPLDVVDHEALRRIVMVAGADLICNAAAYTAVDRAEGEPQLAHAINAVAPGILAEQAATQGIPLVHFSTDYVFPGDLERPLRENDPVGPLSTYGASKLAGEEAIRASGCRYKIFRLCWVYAPRGRNFCLTMLRLARERDELRVVVDQIGCPTPASWIASATVEAAVNRPELNGTWHLCASGSTSWHGFAQAIIDEALNNGLLSRSVPVIPISTSDYPTAARRPANSVLDASKLAKDFGSILPNWRDGVVEVLRDVRRQAQL